MELAVWPCQLQAAGQNTSPHVAMSHAARTVVTTYDSYDKQHRLGRAAYQ